MPLLGREAGTQVFRDLDEHPGDETFPGIVVLRIDSGVFFATAQALDDRVRDLDRRRARAGSRGWCSTSRPSPFIDSQGSEQLAQIHQLVQTRGATLRLARVKPPVLAVLRRDGVIDRIGADHVHGNVHRAVEAQRAAERSGQPAT